MKNLLILLLSLALPLAGCGLLKEYLDPEPQPMCDTSVVHIAALGSIAITGDGDGMPLSHDIMKQILASCPDCRTRFDTGDVYPDGVSTKADYEDKIASVDKQTERIPGFQHFRALGNHNYRGKPQLQVDLSGQCYQYAVTDNLTWKAMVIDTNRPTSYAKERAWKYMCGHPQRDLQFIVGHHPAYAHSSQAPRESQKVAVREWILDLLQSDCVDMYIAGHDHHQEVYIKRWVETKAGRTREYSVFTLVEGGGGRKLRAIERLPNDPGQLAIFKQHGFAIIRGRTIYLYNEFGFLLGQPIVIPRKR